MLRLIFNSKYNSTAGINPGGYFNIGGYSFYKDSKQVDMFTSEKRITNYIDFLNTLKKESEIKFVSEYQYIFDKDTDELFVFRRYQLNNTSVKLVCIYKPENKTLLELTKNIFRENSYALKTANSNFFPGVNPDVLRVIYSKYNIIDRGEKPFRQFKIKSKNGKIREITAPHLEIKTPLKIMNEVFQNVYDWRNSDFQIAYKKGKCVKDGVLLHVKNKYVFNVDLKDFYPSCKRELVSKYIDFLFRETINSDFTKKEFLDAILINDALFIGSPVSGVLANAIISKPMTYLKTIAEKFRMTVSIYADDISFSSKNFIKKETIESILNSVFEKYSLDEYFKLNEKKSVGFSKSRRKVTGIVINNSNKVTVQRDYYRNLRVALDKLDKGQLKENIQSLRGKVAYAMMIDDSGKILKYLKKYKRTVKKYSLYSGKL